MAVFSDVLFEWGGHVGDAPIEKGAFERKVEHPLVQIHIPFLAGSMDQAQFFVGVLNQESGYEIPKEEWAR